jgi:hypothetical protein
VAGAPSRSPSEKPRMTGVETRAMFVTSAYTTAARRVPRFDFKQLRPATW